jgi:hypothetical protein
MSKSSYITLDNFIKSSKSSIEDFTTGIDRRRSRILHRRREKDDLSFQENKYKQRSIKRQYYPDLNYNKELFGSFSISAAVRPPYNYTRGNPNIDAPIYPGVN